MMYYDENTGEFIIPPKEYSVYVLFLNNQPVYIGCTHHIGQRISLHRWGDKDFDSYCVFKKFSSKTEARQFERYMIIILDLFGNVNLYNYDATSKVSHINMPKIIPVKKPKKNTQHA